MTLLELEDAVGDELGDGDYTYPLASDFATDSGGGLWDATKVTVRQSAWNAQFIIEMDDMTDIWGLANGFSHQIVQIYVDQGNTSYGETEMLTGANAEVHPDWLGKLQLAELASLAQYKQFRQKRVAHLLGVLMSAEVLKTRQSHLL